MVASATITITFLVHDQSFGTLVVIGVLNIMLVVTVSNMILVPRFYYAIFLNRVSQQTEANKNDSDRLSGSDF